LGIYPLKTLELADHDLTEYRVFVGEKVALFGSFKLRLIVTVLTIGGEFSPFISD
jgi:hypothetical protein